MFRSRIELADTSSEVEKSHQRHEVEMKRAEERTKELEVALRAADEVLGCRKKKRKPSPSHGPISFSEGLRTTAEALDFSFLGSTNRATLNEAAFASLLGNGVLVSTISRACMPSASTNLQI